MAIQGLIGMAIRFFSGSGGAAARGMSTEAALKASSSAPEDLDKYVNKKLDNAEKALSESMVDGSRILREEIINAIKEVDAVASRQLMESVTVQSMTASTEQTVITVGSSSVYAQFVEEGVKPGGKQPPSDRIMEWMISKGMEPSESGAYLIGRKIRQQGIKPRYPFRTGIQRAEPLIRNNARIKVEESLKK